MRAQLPWRLQRFYVRALPPFPPRTTRHRRAAVGRTHRRSFQTRSPLVTPESPSYARSLCAIFGVRRQTKCDAALKAGATGSTKAPSTLRSAGALHIVSVNTRCCLFAVWNLLLAISLSAADTSSFHILTPSSYSHHIGRFN